MIHTDFQRGFIKAEVVSYDDLIAAGSMAAARAARQGAHRGQGLRHARRRRRGVPLQRLTCRAPSRLGTVPDSVAGAGAIGGRVGSVDPWMIDELVYAGPEHLDPAFVAGYDRKQGWPPVEQDVALLREHGVQTVVDLGTGTGRFALAAAANCARVVAVDVSPAMLEHVRRAAAAAEVSTVEIVRAGFLSYQHAGPPVDAVHTRNALHQLPDFWKGVALDRIAGLLRPGGILRLHDLVYDFLPAEAPAVFHQWLDDASSDPAVGYTAEEYATHVRTEFSTYRWLLEPMLDATGFEILSFGSSRRLYASWTCRRR